MVALVLKDRYLYYYYLLRQCQPPLVKENSDEMWALVYDYANQPSLITDASQLRNFYAQKDPVNPVDVEIDPAKVKIAKHYVVGSEEDRYVYYYNLLEKYGSETAIWSIAQKVQFIYQSSKTEELIHELPKEPVLDTQVGNHISDRIQSIAGAQNYRHYYRQLSQHPAVRYKFGPFVYRKVSEETLLKLAYYYTWQGGYHESRVAADLKLCLSAQASSKTSKPGMEPLSPPHQRRKA